MNDTLSSRSVRGLVDSLCERLAQNEFQASLKVTDALAREDL
jgi:hypothetical protein